MIPNHFAQETSRDRAEVSNPACSRFVLGSTPVKRIGFVIGLLLAIATPASPNSTLTLAMPITDRELVHAINGAVAWKNFFLLCARFTPEDSAGYVAFAAYYAGREAHATELLHKLYAAHGITPPAKVRDE